MTDAIPSRAAKYPGRARSFNWDLAQRLHAAGVPIREIADAYGVTYNAVWYAVNPDAREKRDAIVRAWRDRRRSFPKATRS